MLKGIVAAVVAVAAVGLGLFEPWRAFTDSTVDESVPVAVTTPELVELVDDGATTIPAPAAPAPTSPPAGPVELARGTFVDAEHGTDGVARVIVLADGRRFLRLEGLDTFDGPDLHVWLSDRPSGGSWGSYDDGRFLRLGALKANHGNQNYPIPDDARLDALTTAVIWCDRFDVAFGTAPSTWPDPPPRPREGGAIARHDGRIAVGVASRGLRAWAGGDPP